MYKIPNPVYLRNTPTYVIITHMKNLFPNDFPLNFSITRGSSRYTWNTWEDYFLGKHPSKSSPVHYFIELLSNDYVVFKSLPDNAKSYYLDHLVSTSVLEQRYTNSIVIGIQEDLEVDMLEKRLYDVMVTKILAPLIANGLNKNNIFYIDDVINENFIDRLPINKVMPLTYYKERFFDRNALKQSITTYREKFRGN